MSDSLFYLQITFDKAQAVHGEATTSGLERQIEIDSFRWAMNVKEVRKAVAGRESNAVQHGHLTLGAYFDLSTVNLLNCLAKRDRFSLARLSAVQPLQPNDKPRDVMVIELRGGYVEDVRLAVNPGKVARLKTDIRLSYTGIGIDYHPAKATRDARSGRLTFSAQVSKLADT